MQGKAAGGSMLSLTARALRVEDVPMLVSYLCTAEEHFLSGMGLDKSTMPTSEELADKIRGEISKLPEEKELFFVIWEKNGVPVGHANLFKIVFGEKAYMRFHVWKNVDYRSGLSQQFVAFSLPIFFHMFHLKKLSAEPCAVCHPPFQSLSNSGFKLECTYDCALGWMNFHQSVNKYSMTLAEFEDMYQKASSPLIHE